MEIALVIVVVILVVALVLVVVRGRQLGRAAGIESQDQLVVENVELRTQLEDRDHQLDQIQAELGRVRDERDLARQELSEMRGRHEGRTEELAEARKQIETQFKGIASSVVEANSKVFLEQAKVQFDNLRKLSDTDLEKRQQAIDELVKPVVANLEKLEKQTNEMEKSRAHAYGELRTQVGLLRDVTGNLSEALRSPHMRGQWGEQQLRNILEMSGMLEHVDFLDQATVSTGDGHGRPDALVHVPRGVEVVIDSKTPLDSYLDARNTDDEKRQRDLLDKHAKSLLDHAKTLGGREYASSLSGSPDFVLMFVPADPILDAAMDVQPTLWEDAWQRHRVLIATPGLLLAFLRTVALAWQQQHLQENAREIADTAKQLYERLGKYTKDVAKMGRGLGQAINAYNASVGALQGRVLPPARRLETLGPAAGLTAIEEPSQVEAIPRQVVAPELVEAEAEPSGRELPGAEGD